MRELVRLIDDVPLKIDWESSHLGPINLQQAENICRELGLHRLADRLVTVFATSEGMIYTLRGVK